MPSPNEKRLLDFDFDITPEAIAALDENRALLRDIVLDFAVRIARDDMKGSGVGRPVVDERHLFRAVWMLADTVTEHGENKRRRINLDDVDGVERLIRTLIEICGSDQLPRE